RARLLPRWGRFRPLVPWTVSRENDLGDFDPIGRIFVRAKPKTHLAVAGDAEFVIPAQRRQQVAPCARAERARPVGVRLEARRQIMSAGRLRVAGVISQVLQGAAWQTKPELAKSASGLP